MKIEIRRHLWSRELTRKVFIDRKAVSPLFSEDYIKEELKELNLREQAIIEYIDRTINSWTAPLARSINKLASDLSELKLKPKKRRTK